MSQFLLQKKLCFETGTHPPFRPMSQNTQFFFEGFPYCFILLRHKTLNFIPRFYLFTLQKFIILDVFESSKQKVNKTRKGDQYKLANEAMSYDFLGS